MKRSVAVVMGLLLVPLAAVTPAAEATGGGACTITGTIVFSHPPLESAHGVWTIEPAVITCQGLYNGYERFTGPGKFAGTGSYTALPTRSGTCLHHLGSGTVDYTFATSGADIHLVEPQSYALAGAGAFTTPSLRGTFQVSPPYDGDCVTKPVVRALFVAEATLVRFQPPDKNRYIPRLPKQ